MNTSPYLGSSIPPWTCRLFLARVCFSQSILSLASNCILFFERQPVLKLCISISSTYSFLLISICYHPLSSAIIRYHPLSSTFIYIHPCSSCWHRLHWLQSCLCLSFEWFGFCTRLYLAVPGCTWLCYGLTWSTLVCFDWVGWTSERKSTKSTALRHLRWM